MAEPIDWRQFIHVDPKVLAGKPVIRGTRISVEFLMGLFAGGWTEEMVLENYPHLAPEEIRAAFAFVAECLHDVSFYAVPASA